jgi:hypothetical protein
VLEGVATDNPAEGEDAPVGDLKPFCYCIGGEPGDQVSTAHITRGIEYQQKQDDEQGAKLYEQVQT